MYPQNPRHLLRFQRFEKGDIVTRGKLEQSMMPEGLLNTFAPSDLANLLAFLESLKTK